MTAAHQPIPASPEVSALVEAAVVRQVRVLGFFALLLAVIGFFAGHYIATKQARTVQTGLTAQIDRLRVSVATLSSQCRNLEEQQAATQADLHRLSETQPNVRVAQTQRTIAMLPPTATAVPPAVPPSEAGAAPSEADAALPSQGGFEFLIPPSDGDALVPSGEMSRLPQPVRDRNGGADRSIGRRAPRRMHFFSAKPREPAPPAPFQDAGLIPLPPR